MKRPSRTPVGAVAIMPGLAATPNREPAVRESSFEHREEEIEQLEPHPAAEPIKLPDFNPAAVNRQPQVASGWIL